MKMILLISGMWIAVFDHNLHYTGYSDGSETVTFIKAFEKYLQGLRPSLQREEIEERRSFNVSIKSLLSHEGLKEDIPDLADLLLNSPERVISCLGLAMHQVRHFLSFNAV